jgi:hypothetical protein
MVGFRKRERKRPDPAGRHLHPHDFTFFGFGALSQDEIRQITRLAIRSGAPGVSIVDDAIFVPNGYRYALHQEPSRFGGGVIGPDGQPVTAARLRRKGRNLASGELAVTDPDLDRAASCDGEAVYLGHLFNHYGRVLLESLSRVWYLAQADPSLPVIFNAANAAQTGYAPWVLELLSLFGIPAARILRLDRPTRIRRVIVPEALFEQFYAAHAEMLSPFRAVAARIAGGVTPSSQPLYLSRRRLSSRQRALVGEDELETILRDNGFRIAYPEAMPIAEQIRLLNSHADIISSAGSAAHGILFALGAPRLHLLVNRDHVPANYYLCSALTGAPTTFINCLSTEHRTPSRGEPEVAAAGAPTAAPRFRDRAATPVRQAMPQLLDLRRLLLHLDERGFLARRPPADGTVPPARLRGRLHEAALYTRIRRLAGKSVSLPAALEDEALALAAISWPISLILAQFYARARNIARMEVMAGQFAALVRIESDKDRLAHYRGDVQSAIVRICRLCDRETASLLSHLWEAQFGESRPDLDNVRDS